ncbi:Uncharacterised protein [uncultured archaeon]|nr:Uncharacterised protein [uncultured archaeon]
MMLLVAIAAIYWPEPVRLEGELTLFSATSTGCIVHLSSDSALWGSLSLGWYEIISKSKN